MRTALCLSGQPRNIKMGFPYINKFLIQPFKSDVFVHTWVNPEDVGKKIYHPVNNNVLSDPIEENVGDIILDLYHPICWKFEKQIQFDPKDFKQEYPSVQPVNVFSMWYSVWQAFGAMTQYEAHASFQYDFVIRARFDWAVSSQIGINPNAITCPNDSGVKGGINDQFAASSRLNMEIYCGLFNRIEQYYREDKVPFCNELMIAHHLKKNNVSIAPVKISYGIIRSSEHIHWKL